VGQSVGEPFVRTFAQGIGLVEVVLQLVGSAQPQNGRIDAHAGVDVVHIAACVCIAPSKAASRSAEWACSWAATSLFSSIPASPFRERPDSARTCAVGTRK